ncbi:putative bifunctional diguanylate cyclase/phosphodiesterase [Selenomonas bovis]|uniref:putative bifunctional diguanylate cyclase/phosphodiesterase n=1 Tax=Selenomonas bovis TaxID=416586 RepID=UPI0006907A4E|nr:GGDEF domain-containing phosphodiesterase [Selenomonas bovis]
MERETGRKLSLPLAFCQERRDELTGLSTMTAFMEQAGKEIQVGGAAFLYFNMENFRLVNQRYGFQAGNQLLIHIAQVLSDIFGAVPMARLNDDRFVVMTRAAHVALEVERARTAIYEAEPRLSLVVKVGVYEPEAGVEDIALILDRAKLACDSIKGMYDRDIAWFDPSMEEALNLRTYLVTHFYEALEKGWIEVFYQPEVRALTREICGFEALARWRDPERGLISPGVFVPVLEDAHLIDRLDLYVLQRVCEDLQHIRREGLDVTHISVNLSRIDFQLNDMLQEVKSICCAYGVPRGFLHIEITESALNESDTFLKTEIGRLRGQGFELWMDDFGSGYSSLNNLKDFQFDMIKIDMAFLCDFATKPQSRVIISAVVDMAKKLGLHTLAEGVETEEQYAFLKSIGCETLQGYLFSPPVPLAEILPILRREEGQLQLEDFRAAAFFDAVGAVNVLSTQPLVLMEGERSAPPPALGIFETRADEGRLLYGNAELDRLCRLAGFDSAATAIATNNQCRGDSCEVGNARFWDLVARCRRTRRVEHTENVMNGRIFSIAMRCIGGDEAQNRAAFVYQLIDLSQFDICHQESAVEVATRHLLQIYTRIDLFTADGKLENLIVDTTQQRVMDFDSLSEEGVRRYAQMYIVPEDRERFLRFYDMTTVLARARHAHNDHVTAIFYVRDEGTTEAQPQMFIIVPFRLEGKWCYLSCVRRIDNLDATASSVPPLVG